MTAAALMVTACSCWRLQLDAGFQCVRGIRHSLSILSSSVTVPIRGLAFPPSQLPRNTERLYLFMLLCVLPTLLQVQAEGRRNKVPLEKGFSQVSWLKLTKSNTDLTGACVGEACIPAMRKRCCGVGIPSKGSFPICRKFPTALTEWRWC
jgi:hypothetical protein